MCMAAKFPNNQQNKVKDVTLDQIKERLKSARDKLNSTEGRTSGIKKKKATLESEKVDWKQVRDEAYASHGISRPTKILDKVDWKAVLHESVDMVEKTIECRGNQRHMALRIQVISHTYL